MNDINKMTIKLTEELIGKIGEQGKKFPIGTGGKEDSITISAEDAEGVVTVSYAESAEPWYSRKEIPEWAAENVTYQDSTMEALFIDYTMEA